MDQRTAHLPSRRATALVESVDDYVEHFRARVLQDAINEATAAYWQRRAATFRAARPRRGEFHGTATPEDLSVRWHRLTATADACEHRAAVALRGDAS